MVRLKPIHQARPKGNGPTEAEPSCQTKGNGPTEAEPSGQTKANGPTEAEPSGQAKGNRPTEAGMVHGNRMYAIKKSGSLKVKEDF